MTDRHPHDGRPYYCQNCGAGLGEYLACEEPQCELTPPMTERIELKYIGVCKGGPWDGQEIHGERPIIKSGPWRDAQYFHENGAWYWEHSGLRGPSQDDLDRMTINEIADAVESCGPVSSPGEPS